MTRNECNGWSNYETWCVNLWMSNDQGSDEFFRDMAQETYNEATPDTHIDGAPLFTRDEVATRNLADILKDHFEEEQEQLTGMTGVFADLLNAAMSEVNWHEIASHFIADITKS